ncbi:winged helix DNA-binding domain-containing protein [Actinomycetospora termitidis]|uniref:Winged helix DNA-binding domain-containing protein n=1 Tax=Actinomycetospora termitidis TaxID=3053470 RepID=A0ABT7MAS8_9PSEU|nr:winged helix DNA-binding domain-containing protein [Actinomycetospora sp. Odt1-22]MDL5156947.1 winged helix DNA-binding domain-containing protein [Actinomycetospora sp. Odt1-22]
MNTVGRQRLAAMRLVGERWATPHDAAAALGCAQGQDLPGVLSSIALRTASGDEEEVRRAFDDGTVVRSWPMRGTLHVVAAEDLAWMLPLGTPRPLAAAAKRREGLGLAEATLERAGEVAAEALRGGGRKTRAEMSECWADAGLDLTSSRAYHSLSVLSQRGLLVQGPFATAKEQAFVLLDEWVPEPTRLGRDEALVEWARRYFRSHGPAHRKDFARWTGLPAADVSTAIDGVRDELTESDGLLHDPELPERLAAAEVPDELLLPGFDEFVLGYADRSHVLDPEHADRIVPGNNGIFRPTVVRDGRVVGTWARKGSGRNRRVERELF